MPRATIGAMDRAGGSVPDERSSLGREGEAAAVAWYRAGGYRVVARNWRCRIGEIDLVLERRGVLVFCEVKTRTGSALGGPFEAVTDVKRRKLLRLAEAFLVANGHPGGGVRFDDVRFDVASVLSERGSAPNVHVFEDAF